MLYTYSGKSFVHNNKIFETPWTPNRFGGLVFWGDANSRNIIKNSDNTITKWYDSSGKLNNATSYGSYAPLFVNNYINGYPAIYFQNSKNLNLNLSLNYFTIFCVVKSNNNNIVYEYGNNTNNETGFYLNGGINTVAVSNNGLSNSASVKKLSTNWLSGGWKIIVHQYDGTHLNHIMFINGNYISLANYLSYSLNPGSLNATKKLNIGAKYDGSSGINGYIPEYLVFDSFLQFNDMEKVTNYLNSKYLIY